MDAVKLGERAVVVVGRIGEELALRLLAEALGIDEKQDALHPAKLQQTIRGGDGGKGLARAGRHLHKRTGTIIGKGCVEVVDRPDLAIAEAGRVQHRQTLQIVAHRVRLRQQRA